MKELDYLQRVDHTLETLFEILEDALEDADIEYHDGVLTIELDSGGQYVINRHVPLQELWWSSPVSGAIHFTPQNTGEWWSNKENTSFSKLLKQELNIIFSSDT